MFPVRISSVGIRLCKIDIILCLLVVDPIFVVDEPKDAPLLLEVLIHFWLVHCQAQWWRIRQALQRVCYKSANASHAHDVYPTSEKLLRGFFLSQVQRWILLHRLCAFHTAPP